MCKPQNSCQATYIFYYPEVSSSEQTYLERKHGESVFEEKAHESVGVEDKLVTWRLAVPNERVQTLHLVALRQTAQRLRQWLTSVVRVVECGAH